MHRRGQSQNMNAFKRPPVEAPEVVSPFKGEAKQSFLTSTTAAARVQATRANMKNRFLALGGFLVLVLVWTSGRSYQKEPVVQPPVKVVAGPHDNDAGAQYLHVLIHANNKGPNLCKTVVSAGALNYPIPTILNWKSLYNSTTAVNGGSEIYRIEGIADYIDYAFRKFGKRDDDVAIILDGYDTWFQLRPDVMLERFFEINRLANNRVVQHMGQEAMDAGGVRQRIVFGVQKECSGKREDPACWAVPQSPLAKNIYGKGTTGDRFLNAGFIMGELGALRNLFNQANATLQEDRDHSTLQDVMAKFYGEQEYHRELLSQQYQGTGLLTRFGRFFGLVDRGVLAMRPTGFQPSTLGAGETEYNIGLDYGLLLTSSTENGNNLEFLIRNDTKAVTAIKKKAGITVSDSIYKLSDDIQRSLEPYWARNPSKTLPQKLGWIDTSLFTNLWTGTVPASIQHTSIRMDPEHNPSNLRISGWPKLWFHDHMRTLLDEHVNEPYRSIAVLNSKEKGETAWWPLYLNKWRLRDHIGARAKKEWIAWEDVCGGDGIDDEVFRDKKGVWKPPRYDY